MAKHRRWSDKSDSDLPQTDIEIELAENSTSSKTPTLKSIILSGTKYLYIIAIAALLAGIFTPFTLGVEYETVILGIFIIFLGLAGGILIFLGINKQKFTSIMILSGLGMLISSVILIHEIANRSIFG
tara:strand:- start:202 stop:585 length:384 start_codon:yes stop_codon:yes gene_type:complete